MSIHWSSEDEILKEIECYDEPLPKWLKEYQKDIEFVKINKSFLSRCIEKLPSPFYKLYYWICFRKLRKEWKKHIQNMPKTLSNPKEFISINDSMYKLWNVCFNNDTGKSTDEIVKIIEKAIADIEKA